MNSRGKLDAPRKKKGLIELAHGRLRDIPVAIVLKQGRNLSSTSLSPSFSVLLREPSPIAPQTDRQPERERDAIEPKRKL